MPVIEASLSSYVFKTLGLECTLTPWSSSQRLPMMYRGRYSFKIASLLQKDVLFCLVKPKADPTPLQLDKDLQHFMTLTDGPVAFVLPEIKAYERARLIDKQIPFVVPGKQLFLPFFGIDLWEHFRKEKLKTEARNTFRPTTQMIALALLYKKNKTLRNKSHVSYVAARCGVSKASASRAFDELVATGEFIEIHKGQERYIKMERSSLETFHRLQEWFIDPVMERKFVSGKPPVAPKAGMSGLALMTNLAHGLPEIRAMQNMYWKSSGLSEAPAGSTKTQLELWRYNPTRAYVSSPDHCPQTVGPLSLWLSMRGETDPRVEAALNDVLETVLS